MFTSQPVKALVCQLLALGCALGLASRLTQFGIGVIGIIGIQAVLAALLSRLIHQPIWWLPIHLLFLPSAWLLLSYRLPPWIYLFALLVWGLVFWGTIKGEVPLFLSSAAVVDALCAIVDAEKSDSLIDLGAGVGSVVVALSMRRPQLKITAIENAPLPWLILACRCRHLPNVKVLRKNLWNHNLSEYGIVFSFLSPVVMQRLGAKCRQEMGIGSLLVSSSFAVPDCLPERVVEISDRRATRLYCYRFIGDSTLAPAARLEKIRE